MEKFNSITEIINRLNSDLKKNRYNLLEFNEQKYGWETCLNSVNDQFKELFCFFAIVSDQYSDTAKESIVSFFNRYYNSAKIFADCFHMELSFDGRDNGQIYHKEITYFCGFNGGLIYSKSNDKFNSHT